MFVAMRVSYVGDFVQKEEMSALPWQGGEEGEQPDTWRFAAQGCFEGRRGKFGVRVFRRRCGFANYKG